jgi:hypothetical protein
MTDPPLHRHLVVGISGVTYAEVACNFRLRRVLDLFGLGVAIPR